MSDRAIQRQFRPMSAVPPIAIIQSASSNRNDAAINVPRRHRDPTPADLAWLGKKVLPMNVRSWVKTGVQQFPTLRSIKSLGPAQISCIAGLSVVSGILRRCYAAALRLRQFPSTKSAIIAHAGGIA